MSYMMSYMFVNCQLRTRVIHHATSDNDSARSELDHKFVHITSSINLIFVSFSLASMPP